MNTDEVIRDKFEKWTWMKYHWCGKSHEEVFARTTEGSHYDYVRGDIQDSWAAYQQATKESEALFKGAKLEPFRSGGFINKDYDMARVYIDMPINDARQFISALKEADR